MKPFKKVAVGGSFDVLHKGHRTLLKTALDAGEYVLIGLTSSEMIEKDVSSFEKRKKSLCSFLEGKGRYGIVELSNPLGDAASDGAIDAIVVSEETEHMALKINNVRKKNGLSALKILSIPLVLAADGRPISSRRIKRGEIDEEGRVLSK